MKQYLLFFFFLAYSCESPSTKRPNTENLMHKKLKTEWTNLITKFTTNPKLVESTWAEISQHYSEENRAYHNLTHIHNMLQEANKFTAEIGDKEVVQFAIWFHDIIYAPLKKDNELKSAELAKRILSQTNLSAERIDQCYELILLTVTHQTAITAPIDHRLLIDFDLEILSRDWASYRNYSEQVRTEYWMYPAPLFKKGRKEAMGKFLERPTIYQTPFYQQEKEEKARGNIKREMEELL